MRNDLVHRRTCSGGGRYENPRIVSTSETCASTGEVHWAPARSIWVLSMTLGGLWGLVAHARAETVLLFLLTSGVTLCAGHSVGMHRLLIHRSFTAPRWLEYLLVYLGTLVGLGGPLAMTRTHDLRDWAQRQPGCHDYFGHRRSMIVDAWWQMHCELRLGHAPDFEPGPIGRSRLYRFLDRTAMAQQLPWALAFYGIGGWGWVCWGVCARVAVSIAGHWFVGYLAHNRGGQRHLVEGAAVQGYDVRYCGLITFGECWHNNHHAFPGSARLGLYPGQIDPGWWLIRLLAAAGLARDVRTPEQLAPRPELVRVSEGRWSVASG